MILNREKCYILQCEKLGDLLGYEAVIRTLTSFLIDQ